MVPRHSVSKSPVLLLIVITSMIFICETLVMIVMGVLPPFPLIVNALIDAILLTLLLFPFLYFFMFRQLNSLIKGLVNVGGPQTVKLLPARAIFSQSPALLLILIMSAIFFSETIVMITIRLLPPFSSLTEAIIDSIMLTVLLFPTLYLFMFRQLKFFMDELLSANERLHAQIAEREEIERRLRIERDNLKGILDSMNNGVCIIDQQYRLQYVNPVVEREFGPVTGRKCHEYLNDLPEPCPTCNCKEVFARKTLQWEWHSLKNGRTYELFETPITNEDGSISKLEIFHDITLRKNAERTVMESEERYRLLVETMNDGLGSQDENGRWVYANNRLCDMLGLLQEEIVGRPVADFLDEQGCAIYRHEMAKRREGGHEPYEIPWIRKDGEKVFALVSPWASFDSNGGFKGSFAIITDITKQKRTEEALRQSEKQFRHLSFEILKAQETERRRLSCELHDELGGALAVFKLRLSNIASHLENHQKDLRDECEYNLQYIDEIIENVSRISRDLSPSVLADMGLTAALRWMVNNFIKNYQVRVTLNLSEIDHLFSPQEQTVLYRIFQEAFNNIGKYAHAQHVSMTIHKQNGHVSILIEDDGKGFDVARAVMRPSSEKGLGLATMNERARMLGGSMALWSGKGKGTGIELSLPLKKEGSS